MIFLDTLSKNKVKLKKEKRRTKRREKISVPKRENIYKKKDKKETT